ncbi:hypothetical protein NQZ68_000909 [Dissostichus eleginoides]|nr:hypothetical protein NQZ68_000909 [Dissostichus eleginoides]
MVYAGVGTCKKRKVCHYVEINFRDCPPIEAFNSSSSSLLSAPPPARRGSSPPVMEAAALTSPH